MAQRDKDTRWYHEMSASEQVQFQKDFDRTESMPENLLPPDHGSGLEDNLSAGVRCWQKLLQEDSPFYLARIGDCELTVLGRGYFPGSPHKPDMTGEYWRCGFGRDFILHRSELIEAFRDAHLLGVQENWLPWRKITIDILAALGFSIPYPRAVDVHLPYQLLVDGSLFHFLQGKKVLLVGGLAQPLAEAWWRTDFLSSHARFGPLHRITSISAVPMSDRQADQGGAWRDLDRVTAEIERMDFDVALIAAAVPAKILAKRIWSMGKTALDVGFVFDALLGIAPGERALRPCFRDVKDWPVKTW